MSEKSTMRLSQRLIAAAVLFGLSSALAGCGAGGFSSFDPSDLLDWLDTKKKLPGDRKPVFPEGVPGIEQGIPKELYKGANQQQIDQQNADAVAAQTPPPPAEPKPKRGSKSKSKPVAAAPAPEAQDPAAAADPDAAVPSEDGSTAAAPPPPKPKKIVRRRTTAPPPEQSTGQPVQSAAPAPTAQQSASPFPAPLPGGTFTR